MEKEPGLPNPASLFIGVIDFFAVLVPGVIAALLIVVAMGADLQHAGNVLTAALIMGGWVLGHALHGIGSWLDPFLYDPLFKPADAAAPESAKKGAPGYFHKNDRLFRLAIEITDYPGKAAGAGVPGGMYQWARAWLNSHSPEATALLDRHEADSKLFRSLAVLFLIAIPVLLRMSPASLPAVAAGHRPALLAFAAAGVPFSLWRYCDLRNKMIRQCYLTYVQIRFESRAAASRTADA